MVSQPRNRSRDRTAAGRGRRPRLPLCVAAMLALAAAARAGAQADPMGVQGPRTVQAGHVRSSLAGRIDALRERYERRDLGARSTGDDSLPEPPAAAGAPPPPDAPDGEITRQRLQELVR